MAKKNLYKISKNYNLILFTFLLTIMFSFEISGNDMRYFVIIIWSIYLILYSIFHNEKVYINFDLMIFPIILLIIVMYSLINISIHETYESFDVLRCIRACITYMLIFFFLSFKRYSVKKIINVLSNVLLLHAICIILGIIFPVVKDMVMFISQYSKQFMSMRSTGFLSGYDNAGYLCNVGLLLTLVTNSVYKKKLINMRAFIFFVAVIFTSRFNMVCMIFILIGTFLVNIKNNNIKGVINISKYIIIIGLFSIIVWTLTTNIDMGMRAELLNKYPVLKTFYKFISTSYADYGKYTSVISRHATINLDLKDMIFGAGVNMTQSDIGFVKTIYSMGIIGVIIQLSLYLKSILYVNKIKRLYKQNNNIKILAITFSIAVVLMIVMETKNSFVFASTTFEMLSLMYITIGLSKIKVNA